MRLSTRADYALRAAIELAAAHDDRVTAEHLARAQDIPGHFLETILTHLRRSNIVRSQRGPDGGFWLARPATEISLADIVKAIDGQVPGLRAGSLYLGYFHRDRRGDGRTAVHLSADANDCSP